MIDEENIPAFLEYLKQVADNLRTDAAFGGEFGDRGAGALEDQVKCYVAGQKGYTPEVWSGYVHEFNRLNDPEYDEYQRLKAKFG